MSKVRVRSVCVPFTLQDGVVVANFEGSDKVDYEGSRIVDTDKGIFLNITWWESIEEPPEESIAETGDQSA